jgi:peptidoglycan L-alanyl-D-glutamate endopeptidase CwlK
MASRDTKDLHFILKEAYEKACLEYKKRYPLDPQPFACCTYRSNEEQLFLFNQPKDGIDNNGNGIIDEASEKVTQALPSQSPHNYLPSLAFDIAFINLKQKLDWNKALFERFAKIIKEIEPRIIWGGDWNNNGNSNDEKFPDAPHFELKNWANYKNVTA